MNNLPLKTNLPPPCVVLNCKACNASLYFTVDDVLAHFKQETPADITIECYQCKTEHIMPSIYSKKLPAADKFGRIQIPVNASYVYSKAGARNGGEKSSGALVSSANNTGYYETLGVNKTATADEIKKAYYKLAMKYHPDKYTGSNVAENEEKFKVISEAYQTLSDPVLRERYDRYGKESSKPEGGFADPEKFFKDVFGGDMFADIIGELSISRDLGEALHNMQNESNGPSADSMTPEEREKKRKERVKKLAGNLIHKINILVENPSLIDNSNGQPPSLEAEKVAIEEFTKKIFNEAEELKHASYGVELLHAIGFMYSLKARQWIGKEDTLFGLGKIWNDVRERGHFISGTFGTIRSAVELQSTLTKLQESEELSKLAEEGKPLPTGKKAPKMLSPEEKAKLEEYAAKKGLDTIWKGSKMEVESIIKEVCDLVLSGKSVNDPSGQMEVSKAVIRKRAQALAIIGQIYEAVKPLPVEHE